MLLKKLSLFWNLFDLDIFQLDSFANEQDFGFVVAVYSIGQLFGALLFGKISNHLSTVSAI